VEEAHEGTLFLDEIGDLSPNMQTKLLRLLQEGEYKPVGSLVTKKADIRFVAATNHNLKTEINEKRFREDLYYRLNVVHIELPPLKDRKKDIPLLSYHFLKKYARVNQKDVLEISPEAMQVLISGEYPGNVRELENIIERGIIFCTSKALTPKDLQLDWEEEDFYPQFTGDIGRLSFKEAKEKMIDRFHNQYIMALLRESGGNISRAADMAGIQRQYLHRLMKEAGIDADQFKQKSESPASKITLK
jgi:DNA-binding NtrC family response regulator